MRSPNPLQDQLLKAGLVNKRKAAKAMREQASQRKGNAPATASAGQLQARQQREEKAARDRALATERNARRQRDEARAQARQIIATRKLECDGDMAYRFADGDRIREIL